MAIVSVQAALWILFDRLESVATGCGHTPQTSWINSHQLFEIKVKVEVKKFEIHFWHQNGPPQRTGHEEMASGGRFERHSWLNRRNCSGITPPYFYNVVWVNYDWNELCQTGGHFDFASRVGRLDQHWHLGRSFHDIGRHSHHPKKVGVHWQNFNFQ